MADGVVNDDRAHTLRMLCVAYCAALVLILETVLFHVVQYVHDYYAATLVISYAVVGIGIGAACAGRVRCGSGPLFIGASIGGTLCIYLALGTLVYYPAQWLLSLSLSACFIWPAVFIAKMFEGHDGHRVYCFDLLGAFCGVIVTVALFRFLRSEGMLLLLVATMPLCGLIAAQRASTRWQSVTIPVQVLLVSLGGYLFYLQHSRDAFNLFNVINSNTPGISDSKIFKLSPGKLDRSYDELVGRIDVTVVDKDDYYMVSYDGFGNDHFTSRKARDYDTFYGPTGAEWPTTDCRILYGLVREPRVFVIGSAAQGIIKSVKKITKCEKIFPVEINPAIVRIMQDDYFDESAQAYRGLKPIVGNALGVLNSIDAEFDIITLINTHSTKSITLPGAPDYLHTLEHYQLYLNHLSSDGYILFEERPTKRSGELALFRMINTAWHALQARGAVNPSQHFVVWEWQAQGYPRIEKEHYKYYVSLIVSREPLIGARRAKAIAWIENCALRRRAPLRIAYFQDYAATDEYGALFRMIETGDFSRLAGEGFDARLVTNNRPFAAVSSSQTPQLDRMLLNLGIPIAIVVGVLGLAGAVEKRRSELLLLNVFNALVGAAYFLLEVILLQAYQTVFVGASATLVLVLGVVLLGSGIGGYCARLVDARLAVVLLAPVALLTLYAPGWLFARGLAHAQLASLGVGLLGVTGFLMGVFFPKGIQYAQQCGLQCSVPRLFAINSLSGAFAVVLSLWLGVKLGYKATVIIVVVLYAVAVVVLEAPAFGHMLARRVSWRKATRLLPAAFVAFVAVGILGASVTKLRIPDVAVGAGVMQSRSEPLCSEIIDQSLALGKRFLLHNQKADGSFTYEFDFVAGRESEENSQVRQAGALWSLALLHQAEPSSETGAAIRRGLAYFDRQSKACAVGGRYIVFPGSSSGRTGTVALVALALIDYLRVENESEFRSSAEQQLEGYVDFLLTLRTADGQFHSQYRLADGKGRRKPSPYFDGEVLLALTKAAKYAGRVDLPPLIMESAETMYDRHVEQALLEHPDSAVTKGFYQWGSMAFHEMHTAAWEGVEVYASRIINLAYWMIDVHQTLQRHKNTAYAHEGLAVAWETARLAGNRAAMDKIGAVIDEGLRKLISWQVGGPLQNSYLRRKRAVDPRAIGGVMNSAQDPKLRIDVTQHQVHALLLARRFLYGEQQ